jgi:hypothetical protein
MLERGPVRCREGGTDPIDTKHDPYQSLQPSRQKRLSVYAERPPADLRAVTIVLRAPTASRGCPVLDLDPIPGRARPVGRTQSLRHDAFEPELAGVPKHRGAATLVNLINHAGRRFGHNS